MQHTPVFPAPSAYKTAIQCPFAGQWLILLLIFSRLKPETSASQRRGYRARSNLKAITIHACIHEILRYWQIPLLYNSKSRNTNST